MNGNYIGASHLVEEYLGGRDAPLDKLRISFNEPSETLIRSSIESRAVAADFIRRGVRCNAICPGTVESPSLEQRIATLAQQSGQSVEAVRKAFVDRQPMGRIGRPDEIAALAVYLASDESAFTTGQAHIVDGGFAL